MFEIEYSNLEQETIPISFSCPITINVTLPIAPVTKAPVDPLEGLVNDNPFLDIHFSQVITSST